MLLQQKLLLFSVPAILVLGTGLGVAYHDGAFADDVKHLDDTKVGDDVAFKGRVILRDATCEKGDEELRKDVQCFVVRDLEDEMRFAVVSTTAEAPPVDETVVVRGTLEFHHKMEGGSGSSSWEGGCWDAGQYGSGCYGGGSTSWSWSGLEVAWIDASSVAKPWVFSGN